MDVFALAKHEYLQPPVSKHGRQSSNQQQSSSQQNSSNQIGVGGGGSGGGCGTGAGQQTSFSAGMFGNMNQSSSS
jgi:tousled-like kinase